MDRNARPFEKVLVANRGEIACRVIRTLREQGIASVAVFHSSEAGARHVGMADEAVEIGAGSPLDAYLDGDAIIEAASRTGADAVHPGYGFLSENGGFAEAVDRAGLTFIGPDAEVIRLMGDKIAAREFAERHGVPVAPSVPASGDIDAFVGKAAEIGFPLLIKAAAGGGGKGMSIVHERADLAERVRIAASEASRYFSDGRLYAERYVERPRHIEVQVLGDGAGNAVHLFERECSVQRRFQKVIEEAPAAALDPALRERICAAAVQLAAAARYRNAGTVEFILAPDGSFYFLEMNTRLQVEHPVTEMVTGIDLVRCQLGIAAGGALPVRQEDVRIEGHAIECRLCAEDADRDFMPQTGRVLRLEVPSGSGIRFESGLVVGQPVTTSFDPMLAKLVAHGADRGAAIAACRRALGELLLAGVRTNARFLARVLATDAFAAGDLHTGFIAEHLPALLSPEVPRRVREQAVLAALLSFREFRALVDDVPEPYATLGGWRN